MTRHVLWSSLFIASACGVTQVFGQAPPPRVAALPSGPGDTGNTAVAAPAAADVNPIVRPKPLSPTEQQQALTGIDKHIADTLAQLREKLKNLLPDEIGMLAKTNGWTAEQQQNLVTALRANDPTAVFKAWSTAAPQETATAEIASRQTDVRRLIAKLEQDLEKNVAALAADAESLDAALDKISVTNPAFAEVDAGVSSLETWIEARRLVATATPGKGPIAALPKGEVSLIYDPSLAVGTAIVLSDKALLIGNEGHAGVMIKKGLAVEALGLPIVTGTPIKEADWPEMTAGIMLVNRLKTKGTVTYTLDGMRYVMEPGMAQRLDGRSWVVEFDRGGGFGPAAYTLAPGTYHFTPTDEGWQLYKQRFDVVLDNSQSDQEFNFLFQGQKSAVPAGGTRTLTSDYPIIVKFDRGNGTAFSTKEMHFSGIVQVGVNAEDNLWDLFPTNENQREVTDLKLFQ